MKAVVLLSGGIDSAVALWDVKERADVQALTFHYHDRARQEVEATRALAASSGVPLAEIDVPFLREAADLGPERSPFLRDAPEGYVPARNLVFYAIAANVAESLGACSIVGGHHGEDATLFPDASPSFFERFSDLARLGVWSYTRRPFKVELPLRGLTKKEVVTRGLALGVPMGLTWSCYGTGERSCGQCRSCRERLAAFAEVGAEDPIAYAGP